jgi:hypothetical protein
MAGCDAFIVKPSPAPEVVRVIAELLDQGRRGGDAP